MALDCRMETLSFSDNFFNLMPGVAQSDRTHDAKRAIARRRCRPVSTVQSLIDTYGATRNSNRKTRKIFWGGNRLRLPFHLTQSKTNPISLSLSDCYYYGICRSSC